MPRTTWYRIVLRGVYEVPCSIILLSSSRLLTSTLSCTLVISATAIERKDKKQRASRRVKENCPASSRCCLRVLRVRRPTQQYAHRYPISGRWGGRALGSLDGPFGGGLRLHQRHAQCKGHELFQVVEQARMASGVGKPALTAGAIDHSLCTHLDSFVQSSFDGVVFAIMVDFQASYFTVRHLGEWFHECSVASPSGSRNIVFPDTCLVGRKNGMPFVEVPGPHWIS